MGEREIVCVCVYVCVCVSAENSAAQISPFFSAQDPVEKGSMLQKMFDISEKV